MRLQRLGGLLILVGVIALLILHFRIEVPFADAHILHLAAVGGLGAGIVALMVGTIVRGASTVNHPKYRTDWHRTQPQGRPVAFGQTAAPAGPAACSNCRSPLVSGAKFCPRCGAAVALLTPPPQAPDFRFQTIVNPRPPGRFGVFRMLVCLALVAGAIYVATSWRHTGRPPWEDWKLEGDHHPWMNNAPSDSQHCFPTAPDPRMPVGTTIGQAAGCSIGQSSVETAVDTDGTVGIRVHAHVYSSNMTGLRLGAHLRFSDLSRVYSTDVRYRDANGQAVAMAAVPASNGVADVSALIPISALQLQEGNFSLEVLASLYDASGRAVGTCQVLPFTLYRGPASITRVRLLPMPSATGFIDPLRNVTFSVNYTVAHPQPGLMTAVTVRFKDEDGRTVLGPGSVELRVESPHRAVATGGTPLTLAGQLVSVPASLVPPRATAEITVCNQRTGAAISQPVSIRMP